MLTFYSGQTYFCYFRAKRTFMRFSTIEGLTPKRGANNISIGAEEA